MLKEMLDSPIHQNETRVIFSKKRTYKNGCTNTESNGFLIHENGFHNNRHDSCEDYESYSDDEVFMEGPTIDKSLASRPLMHPRHRAKVKSRKPDCRCRKIVKPIVCFLLLIICLASLMITILYVSNQFSSSDKNANSPADSKSHHLTQSFRKQTTIDVRGCDHISVEDVWTAGFPKLNTESAFRLLDVNNDGILDIIVGFGTGADGYYVPDIVCDIYFNGVYPCFGGVMALEGKTGSELWRHYSPHELFGINCNADLDNDGVNDCVCGGRAGAFQAISGKSGKLLWNFDKTEAKNDIMNLYTAQFIPDVDDDGIEDVLAIHGGDPLREPGSKERLSGRIIFFSGSTGDVLRWTEVPDGKESYYSPQIYSWPDGTDIVLFGTGGETHGGSLWGIPLQDLYRGRMAKAVKIYTDPFKGIMTPPVLVDISGDGVEDIIIAMFNSTVMAINGANFSTIWRFHTPMSESYNTPAIGFYNEDDVPDFLVKFAHGPGYPVYYYSQTMILDGRNGKPLLVPPIKDTIGAQSSPLTISVEGQGHDIFLYWMSDCHGHSGEGGKYKFVNGTNVHEQSRSDYCRLRFKSEGYSKIKAINRHIKSPGTTIYYSTDRRQLEHNHWINTTKEGLDYIASHPQRYQNHLQGRELTDRYPSNLQGQGYADRYSEEDDGSMIADEPAGLESPYGLVLEEGQQSTSKKGPKSDRYRAYSDRRHVPRHRNKGHLSSPYYKDSDNGDYRDPDFRSAGRREDPPYSYDGHSQLNDVGRYVNKFGNSDVRLQHARREKRSQIKRNIKNSQWNSVGQQTSQENNKRSRFRNRKRRHVGPHDEEGIQRLLSTGTLAPPTLPRDHALYNHSIDIVFATYWFFPAKTQVLLPKDQVCVDKKLKEEEIRFNVNSHYYGLDHDGYQHTIEQECLHHSGHNLPDDHTYQSQTTYDPFNIHMGQMTVYRLRITCTCKGHMTNNTTRCSNILPFHQQQWRAYMGNHGDSHWIPRSQQFMNNG